MAYFEQSKPIKRDKTRLGVVDGSQVYDMIKENIDLNRAYHDIEPAVVNRVYMKASDLPKKRIAGYDVPDWSLFGTIDASFIYSRNPIPGNIKPLSINLLQYPLKGEMVNVAKYNNEYYYSLPLNLSQQTNMNRVRNMRGDGTVVPQHTKFNRKVWSSHGDTVMQGRFGNHIKFGSDDLYQTPTIKIVNGQSQKIETLQQKNLDADYVHVEDINHDGSSIYMTSGRDTVPLIPATHTYNWPNALFGNQIILCSDSLVFNAKGKLQRDGISLTGTIRMLAADDMIFSVGDQFILESDKIFLGKDAEIYQNPLAKGRHVRDAISDLIGVVKSLCLSIENASRVEVKKENSEEVEMVKTTNLDPQKNALKGIKKNLKKILSKTVFTDFR